MKLFDHHSTSIDDMIHEVESLSVVNYLYCTILLVGIVGNFVNIIVLSRKAMRRLLVFRLLFCLSIVDFIFLILSILQTLAETDLRVKSVFFCKLDTFLAYFLLHIRNVFTIAINFHSKSSI